MQKIFFSSLALIAFIFFGCSTKEDTKPAAVETKKESKTAETKPTLPPQKATEAEVKKALADAEAKYEEAKKQKVAWRYTHKRIADAKNAMSKGEYDKALKLAQEAYYESDQAIIQSQEAELTWKNATPQAILGIKD